MRPHRTRRGTSTVEFAICLPMVVIVVFGARELCTFIHLKESLHVAAYEAVRVVVKDPEKKTHAINRAMAVLQSRGFNNPSITFEPANLNDVLPGGLIKARATMSSSSLSSIPLPEVLYGVDISADATMAKE